MAADKQDSNLTGLRFAEEASLGVLPGTPIWWPLEPNSYEDFGGELATVARDPINPSRQRKKGTVTDLDASGGYTTDLTISALTRLLQGFFFADLRQKPSNNPLNGTAVPATSVTGATHKFNFGADPGAFLAGHLVKSSGFVSTANNVIGVVASTDADDITLTAGLVDEASPPAAATVEVVGFQFGSGTSAIALNGDLVRFTDSATNLTTLGLIPGEWVYLGGDDPATHFATTPQGLARVSAIAAGYLEFDKVDFVPTAETGTGKTIRMFFGNVLKNESDPALIVRRTYQLERTLGEDDDGVMSEYLMSAVANELSLDIKQADKITVQLSFIALDNEQRTGAQGVKSGTRPTVPSEEALNTSNDFNRIKLALCSTTDSTVAPLFAFATDMKLTVNNGVKPLKAIGVLGGFDTMAGTFEVGGSLEAYFANVAAVQAVRNNSDVTLDFAIVKSSMGLLFDVPLISLGDGRLKVEKDEPIKIPLENNAAEGRFNSTLLMQQFPYLPDVAAA